MTSKSPVVFGDSVTCGQGHLDNKKFVHIVPTNSIWKTECTRIRARPCDRPAPSTMCAVSHPRAFQGAGVRHRLRWSSQRARRAAVRRDDPVGARLIGPGHDSYRLQPRESVQVEDYCQTNAVPPGTANRLAHT